MKNLFKQKQRVGVLQFVRVIALVIALVLGTPSAILFSAWAQTFSDGTFNNADWEIFPEIFIDNDLLGDGTVEAFQVEAGGNPGAFRQIQQTLNAADDSATILGFHRNANATYTPATQGAIRSIDFSIDGITFLDGSPPAAGPALMQDDTLYFARSTTLGRGWSTVSFSGLTVEFFSSLNFFTPNFSETGNPITFGFVFSSSGFADLADVAFSGGVDNWSVTITPESDTSQPAPGPASASEPAPPTDRAIFMTTATGSQVVTNPAGGIPTDATCIGTFRPFQAAGDVSIVSYGLQCFGISDVIAAHLHRGSTQDDGPVVATLFPSGILTGPVDGFIQRDGTISRGFLPNAISASSSETLLDLAAADGLYMKVTTGMFPDGHVRGHIVPIDDGNVAEAFFLATGSGGQQRPDSVNTDGRCLATFRDKGNNRLKYKLKCWGMNGVTQAHIHRGSAQQTGDILAVLFPFGEETGLVNGVMRRDNGDKSNGTLSDDDVSGMTVSDLIRLMQLDDVYLNVHTATNLLGEVRGQVTMITTIAGGF